MASKSKAKSNTLIIVESPTKAKTITKFLGSGYTVLSSFGHVRDLPKSKIGVDVENGFEPHYIIPRTAKAHVKDLKEKAKKATDVILATDEDREGEAIAWHIAHVLELDSEKAKRITFHEITKPAIEEALTHPRNIIMNLVDAQQARRILDRLVGYELSPFLWKKIMRGLSAGRVQSAALRLIAEREEEIKKFIPQEYWSIHAQLKRSQTAEEFSTALVAIDDMKVGKLDIGNQKDANAIVTAVKDASWTVERVTKKETKKMPAAPFTTSTLQQEAARKIRFSAKQTMMTAQQLYEGIEIPGEGSVGLITYMRTDSVNIAESALAQARTMIAKKYGENFVVAGGRKFKTKSKGAQEAHEAIRPTDPARDPENLKDNLTPQQWKLYNLIWRRFMASQMEHALFDTTAVDIAARDTADGRTYIFRANGIVKKFAGFLEAYPTKFEDAVLPDVQEKESLAALAVTPEQHATQPPARYTEASLVKALEEHGIGRPSTYAPTISTIQSRGYVDKDKDRRLLPTEVGLKVNTMLVEHFPAIVDIAFTAQMEEELDGVAEGKTDWRKTLKEFYVPFHENLTKKYDEVVKEKMEETTDQVCEKCGSPMVIKMGRFGRFLACSNFPECKNTKTIKKTTGLKCPKCNEGDVVEKRTKKRRTFWGCSRYPECDYATWENPLKKKEAAAEETAAAAEPNEEEESE